MSEYLNKDGRNNARANKLEQFTSGKKITMIMAMVIHAVKTTVRVLGQVSTCSFYKQRRESEGDETKPRSLKSPVRD